MIKDLVSFCANSHSFSPTLAAVEVKVAFCEFMTQPYLLNPLAVFSAMSILYNEPNYQQHRELQLKPTVLRYNDPRGLPEEGRPHLRMQR